MCTSFYNTEGKMFRQTLASSIASSSRTRIAPVLVRQRPQSTYPFRPPPIRERLRPLVPFFIYWTIITSLTVHLLRTRTKAKEDAAKASAQSSVLEGLISRLRQGERVPPDEIDRELEMVGLKERTVLSAVGAARTTQDEERPGGEAEAALAESGQVGWRETIFGRKRRRPEVDEERAEEAWLDGALPAYGTYDSALTTGSHQRGYRRTSRCASIARTATPAGWDGTAGTFYQCVHVGVPGSLPCSICRTEQGDGCILN